MKLLLLGATGRTGRLLLDEALGRNHRVHAIVRQAQGLPARAIGHVNLTLFHGAPDDAALLERALPGCDAIVSALNVSRTSDWPWSPLRSPSDFLSRTMRVVIATARRTGVRRVVITSASGVGDSRSEIPGWFDWFIRHSNLRFPYADHARQEEIVAASTLDWTIVRPTGLTNSKRRQTVRVSFTGTPRPKLLISRQTVAGFLLDAATTHKFLRERPTISAE